MRSLMALLVLLTLSTPLFAQNAPPATAPANAADSYHAAMKQIGLIDENGQRAKGFAISFDQAYLESHQPVRELILKGTQTSACDWGQRSMQDTIDEMSAQRALARFLQADAALWLQKRDQARFLDDALALFSFSHHTSSHGALIHKQVEIAMDLQASSLMGANLPALSKQMLQTIPQRLDALSKPQTGAEMMAAEYLTAKRQVAEQGNNFMMLAMVNSMEPFYREIGKALDEQSPEEFAKTLDLKVAEYKLNPVAQLAIPSTKSVRSLMAAVETQNAMLRTAIDILLNGEPAVAKSKDPYGDGPFAYAKTDNGFVLTSDLKQRDAAVKLVVGK